ncbi:MAG: LPS export ABC transporter periplasmic protein LptC [candidate division NC10 bacterium]|nr:LPS export ABC transporter periplasmic protein LptC [candidate division NC10 bacterium]
MKGRTRILFALLCLIGALGAWFLLLQPGRDASSPPKESSREIPRAKLSGVHLLEMEGNQRMWEAQADRIEVFDEEGSIRIFKQERQIQLVLYRDQDTLICYADAAEMKNQGREKEVHVTGNLRAQARDGITLRTESATWLPGQKRLFTDQQVTITQQGLMIQGLGMEADLTLEEVKILSNITSRFESSGQKFGTSGWGRAH